MGNPVNTHWVTQLDTLLGSSVNAGTHDVFLEYDAATTLEFVDSGFRWNGGRH